jgi:hypothetical protein
MGQANALSNALGQGVNYYQNQQMMNRFFPQQNVDMTPVNNATSSYY